MALARPYVRCSCSTAPIGQFSNLRRGHSALAVASTRQPRMHESLVSTAPPRGFVTPSSTLRGESRLPAAINITYVSAVDHPCTYCVRVWGPHGALARSGIAFGSSPRKVARSSPGAGMAWIDAGRVWIKFATEGGDLQFGNASSRHESRCRDGLRSFCGRWRSVNGEPSKPARSGDAPGSQYSHRRENARSAKRGVSVLFSRTGPREASTWCRFRALRMLLRRCTCAHVALRSERYRNGLVAPV